MQTPWVCRVKYNRYEEVKEPEMMKKTTGTLLRFSTLQANVNFQSRRRFLILATHENHLRPCRKMPIAAPLPESDFIGCGSKGWTLVTLECSRVRSTALRHYEFLVHWDATWNWHLSQLSQGVKNRKPNPAGTNNALGISSPNSKQCTSLPRD